MQWPQNKTKFTPKMIVKDPYIQGNVQSSVIEGTMGEETLMEVGTPVRGDTPSTNPHPKLSTGVSQLKK